MGRLFITGDTHNDLEINRISRKNFPMGKDLNKNDLLLVAGDFGFPWDGSKSDEYWLDWMEDLPFSVAFCDGNHVNFSLLYQYHLNKWCGGMTHILRPHIHHLMRGEIFHLCGHSFFVFGGARSVDKIYRKEGKSWWPEEIASYQEMENGINNLEKNNFNVDYILTHCAPNRIVDILFPYENQHDTMSSYLEHVCIRTTFDKFFCGHYHINRNYNNQKYNIIYNDIIELCPNGEIKTLIIKGK